MNQSADRRRSGASARAAALLGVAMVLGASSVGCSSKGSVSSASTTTIAAPGATRADPGSHAGATSTLDAGGAASVPGSTVAAPVKRYQSFCNLVESVQQKLGRLDPAKTTAAQRLAAAQETFGAVTAHAPQGLRADMITVNDFVQQAASLDAMAGSVPADLGPALQRVMAWFSTNCGIDLQVG